jgi:nucleotide-binding universal stress UspA family protein
VHSRILPADERKAVWQSTYRSILVPLDGSTFAEHAISYAVGVAEQMDAAIKLVHIHPSFETMEELWPHYVDNLTLRALKRRREVYLNEVVQRISKESSVRASSAVIIGQGVADTLRAVDFLGADFVVVATHARGLIGRFWLGDVVQRILRRVDMPVMVVRGDRAPVSFAAKNIRHVLTPVDGTATAERALKTAATFGSIVGAKQTLLQVIYLDPHFVIRHGAIRTDWVPSQKRELQALRYLDGLKKSLPIRNEKMHTKVISSDEHTGDVIRSFAERSGADLIAVTAHKRGILPRLLRESTAHYLIRKAGMPILFVPSDTKSERRVLEKGTRFAVPQ